jgi:hypothetical protein
LKYFFQKLLFRISCPFTGELIGEIKKSNYLDQPENHPKWIQKMTDKGNITDYQYAHVERNGFGSEIFREIVEHFFFSL